MQNFLLLYDVITDAKLTGCEWVFDFCRVSGTLAAGSTLPTLTQTTADNMTAMSVSRPLIQFMKTKVLLQDLKGLIPDTTTTDLVARQLSNAVTALTDTHIRTDKANEARREDKLEDKTIGSVYTGLRLIKLGNTCHMRHREQIWKMSYRNCTHSSRISQNNPHPSPSFSKTPRTLD